MQATLDDLRRHYSLLSDESLLATNREELTDVGKLCLDAELAGRGLKQQNAPAEPETSPDLPNDELPVEKPIDLVVIASYEHADDARIAQSLLKSAGIASHRSDEFLRPGLQRPGMVNLLVSPDVAEDATLILDNEISDEELAAQAEAAVAEEGQPESRD